MDDVLCALGDVGAIRAEVSGSGSACFGLFEGEQQAADTAAKLSDTGIWAATTRSVGRGWSAVNEETGESRE